MIDRDAHLFPALFFSVSSQRAKATARIMPASWHRMNSGTLAGAIPAKVSDSERAIVIAGLANEVEDVNQ